LYDLVAAMACFEEVEKTHPDFNGVEAKMKNLRKALDRLKSEAATRPAGTTLPTEEPATRGIPFSHTP